MNIDTFFSVATLAWLIWAVRVLIPKALNSGEGMAIVCAALTAILSLVLWLVLGIATHSASF
jgi:hypothetical protein